MTEAQDVSTETQPETGFQLKKVPPFWLAVIVLAMFGAAVWAGGEIAKGEIAQQQLDSITAQGKVLRVKVDIAPGAEITPEAVEVVDTFANRVEPYCLTSPSSALGKKTRYGLERGQVITVRDLESGSP
ncbi:MAG: hypothetical protein JST01_26600 [Cyanobacteria bacterium SZAS TMP-1]|nr:hypothetical protein [Cyanobacteria bacterium SZAS TMP-1]